MGSKKETHGSGNGSPGEVMWEVGLHGQAAGFSTSFPANERMTIRAATLCTGEHYATLLDAAGRVVFASPDVRYVRRAESGEAGSSAGVTFTAANPVTELVTVGAKVSDVRCPSCGKDVPVDVPGPWYGDLDAQIAAAKAAAGDACPGGHKGPAVVLDESAAPSLSLPEAGKP